MTDIFISWSGDRSKQIALALRNWIPSVLQFAKPYYTPNDIDKGAKWANEISKKLAESHVGIICLTEENFQQPWILFEAGALSKDMDSSRVSSILFGMDYSDLSGPLLSLQNTVFEKEDFRKLMQSVNDAGGDRALPKETFVTVFEKWWPDLKSQIDSILANGAPEVKSNIRPDRDILEEILALARSTNRSRIRSSMEREIPDGLIRDLIQIADVVIDQYESKEEIGAQAKDCIRVIKYLISTSNMELSDFSVEIDRLQEKYDSVFHF